MSRHVSLARDLALLLRPRIGLLASAGSCAGFLVYGRLAENPGLAAAAAGAFLLSSGCSALNQVQERAEDGRMARTKNRPLPAGQWTWPQALALAMSLLALSLILLAQAGGWTGGWPLAGLWLAVLLIYNGLYTPLKKRTSLAMLVGGLAGALPPVVGYAAAGGALGDGRALLLAGVFYAWQVPHFWLFARIHRTDYEAAGFHVPHNGVAASRAPGALRLWLVSYGALMLLIPLFGLVGAPLIKWLVAALALGLVCCISLIQTRERLGFALVNASLALLLACLAAAALRLAA